jgi:hypothetical protein
MRIDDSRQRFVADGWTIPDTLSTYSQKETRHQAGFFIATL